MQPGSIVLEHREQESRKALEPGHAGIKPICMLPKRTWKCCRDPMVTAEISGMGKGRPGWMADVMQGAAAAESIGMDLHGTCLFPAVEMSDWHAGEWQHNGICDLVERDGELVRVPHQPCVDELRDWQTELHHTTEADAEAFSGPVEPQDLIDAAKRLRPRPDQNWH